MFDFRDLPFLTILIVGGIFVVFGVPFIVEIVKAMRK